MNSEAIIVIADDFDFERVCELLERMDSWSKEKKR